MSPRSDSDVETPSRHPSGSTPPATKKPERPTQRTELAKIERSLFDALEAAELREPER